MSIDVIIPTYKPQKGFIELIDKLKTQTILPERIIVINTDEECWDAFVSSLEITGILSDIEVYHVTKNDFDHGRTRNIAMNKSNADICVMMTMDAAKRVTGEFGLMPFMPTAGFGEDLSFCMRARKAGIKLWCDSRVKCGHIGTKIYTGE